MAASTMPLDHTMLVETIAELRQDLTAAEQSRDQTPLLSIDRLSKVQLVAHYQRMIAIAETKLRILTAQPRA